MCGQLDDLHELAIERAPDDLEALLGEGLLVEAVEFVAVPVPLVDDRFAVQLTRLRARLELARIRPKPHRAAEVVHAEQIPELVDPFVGGLGGGWGGVGVGEAAPARSVLDGRPLESITNPEVRDAALARDPRRSHHPARAAIAEATRHENPM